MSVSSHLTPEPERRLWLILEYMRGAVARAEDQIAALAALVVAELIYLKVAGPAGPIVGLSILLLALALPLAVFSYAPFARLPAWLSFIEPPKEKPAGADNLVSEQDLAKYSHLELINKLDRYLGGGITATQYYEDLVGEIVAAARIAARKRRLLGWLLMLAGAAQVALLAAWLSPRL